MSAILLVTFTLSLTVGPVGASALPNLPAPGQAVWLTPVFQPPVLRGMTVHPENPLLFDFIVDRGQDKINNDLLKAESTKLIKYFLASMTIPDKDAWVNLSPYEKDRIIPDALGQTEMGRQMLEQDYMLKQLAASLTNPDTELGKKYWAKVGNGRDRSLQDLTKVWIVPDGATVVEKDGFAYITQSKLKVMMEEDYQTLQQNTVGAGFKPAPTQANNDVSTAVFRSLILPKLIEEVNTGKTFAPTRQVYQSVILAAWYKKALKDSLLGKIYADKSKVEGIESDVKDIKQKVYDQYLEAFKKGVYNVIKEEDNGQELIPRKYFSGGQGMSFVFASTPLKFDDSLVGVRNAATAVIQATEAGRDVLVAASAAETDEAATVKNAIQANQISAASAVEVKADDILALIDREDGVDNGVDTTSIRKIVIKAIQFKSSLDDSNLIAGLKSRSSTTNLFNRMIGDNHVIDLGKVIALIENEANGFDDEMKRAAAALKGLAAPAALATPAVPAPASFAGRRISGKAIVKMAQTGGRTKNAVFRLLEAMLRPEYQYRVDPTGLVYNQEYNVIADLLAAKGHSQRDLQTIQRIESSVANEVFDLSELDEVLKRGSLENSAWNDFDGARAYLLKSAAEYDQEQTVAQAAATAPAVVKPAPAMPLFAVNDLSTPEGKLHSHWEKLAGLADHPIYLNTLQRFYDVERGDIRDLLKALVHFTQFNNGVVANEKDLRNLLSAAGSFTTQIVLYVRVRDDKYHAAEKLTLLKIEPQIDAVVKVLQSSQNFERVKQSIAQKPITIKVASSASSGAGETKAVSASVEKTPYGGIDFDPSKLNLQIKRDGHGVPLPLPQQNLENINIKGLTPVIINILPINAQTLPILSQLNSQPAVTLSKG